MRTGIEDQKMRMGTSIRNRQRNYESVGVEQIELDIA